MDCSWAWGPSRLPCTLVLWSEYIRPKLNMVIIITWYKFRYGHCTIQIQIVHTVQLPKSFNQLSSNSCPFEKPCCITCPIISGGTGRQLIHEDHKEAFSRHVFANTYHRIPSLRDAIVRNKPVEHTEGFTNNVNKEDLPCPCVAHVPYPLWSYGAEEGWQCRSIHLCSRSSELPLDYCRWSILWCSDLWQHAEYEGFLCQLRVHGMSMLLCLHCCHHEFL